MAEALEFGPHTELIDQTSLPEQVQVLVPGEQYIVGFGDRVGERDSMLVAFTMERILLYTYQTKLDYTVRSLPYMQVEAASLVQEGMNRSLVVKLRDWEFNILLPIEVEPLRYVPQAQQVIYVATRSGI